LTKKNFRGYQQIGLNVTQKKRDFQEALDYYREVPPTNSFHPIPGENIWPENPPQFANTYKAYIEQVLDLGKLVMSILSRGFGLPQTFFQDFTDKSFWAIRIIGYPPLRSDWNGLSCGEHSDYGCLTLLHADSTKGALQVKNMRGEWITADPIEGSFLINLGDMLKIWTNGVLQATPHRVIHRNTSYRVSIPFFFEPNFDALIKPLPPFLSDEENNNNNNNCLAAKVYGDHLVDKVYNNFVKFQDDSNTR